MPAEKRSFGEFEEITSDGVAAGDYPNTPECTSKHSVSESGYLGQNTCVNVQQKPSSFLHNVSAPLNSLLQVNESNSFLQMNNNNSGNNAPPPNMQQNIFQYLNSASSLGAGMIGNVNQQCPNNILNPQLYQQLLANFLASYNNCIPNNGASGLNLNNCGFNVNGLPNGIFNGNFGQLQPGVSHQQNNVTTTTASDQIRYQDGGRDSSIPQSQPQ
eukprot:CAMPEP_0113322836 /NCGR_PEP_ID=MMETSP0010_2-20120614/15877_1 /TAXON_ID=216773 ORGANISM="Corethron hystrix, Strain 308" /NCGR_SAMPLE_ID=MMETSP0010_2 /ASSEMBLY_ACC=CAM_ASM_000155 /LENGTH=214 /DNA_ID=CAMNT_0000181481 /DNA_START=80 /DNA_END=721 /DNA_ORIENTATION=+ /assembly_acc=CAM_ASM_000155